MSERLKKFLINEFDELRQNKIRVIALGVCAIVLIIFWISDDTSDGEEILLNESPTVTKDLPVVSLPVEKSQDGVTFVLGANADRLFVGDPFAGMEKPKPPPEPKVTAPPVPPIVIQSPPQIVEPLKPQEKITLTGTAISGSNKTAMFLREEETLFLTVGEEIGGKKISDITPDFVTFENGERIFIKGS